MKTKRSLKKQSFRLLQRGLKRGLIGAAIVQTIACNPSSESLKKYTATKKTFGPVHDIETAVQNYIPADLFMIELDPSTPLIFVAGQPAKALIHTNLNLPGVQYRLVSNDLPRGMTVKDLGNGDWELSWTPSKEILPQNLNEHPVNEFHLSLDIAPVASPQVQRIISTLSTETVFHYTLLRSTTAPEVVDIVGVKNYPDVTEINEGTILPLKIIVKDPSSSNTQKPKLLSVTVPNKINKEQQIISGSAFLFMDTEPRQVGADTWEFNATFDTENNPVPEFKIPDLEQLPSTIRANLTFQILSANRTLSPEKVVTFNIKYKRELLRPLIKVTPPSVYSQDSTWTESFKAMLPARFGEMSVFLTDDTLALPGNPVMSCQNSEKASFNQNCKITWKIPCDLTPGDYQIKLSATGEYEGQKTLTEAIKTVTVKDKKFRRGQKCLNPKVNNSASQEAPASTVSTETIVPTITTPETTAIAPVATVPATPLAKPTEKTDKAVTTTAAPAAEPSFFGDSGSANGAVKTTAPENVNPIVDDATKPGSTATEHKQKHKSSHRAGRSNRHHSAPKHKNASNSTTGGNNE